MSTVVCPLSGHCVHCVSTECRRRGARPWWYLVAGAAHDGREDGPGGVVPGEARLAHAGAIVHHESRYVVVAHVARAVSRTAMGAGLAPRALYRLPRGSPPLPTPRRDVTGRSSFLT